MARGFNDPRCAFSRLSFPTGCRSNASKNLGSECSRRIFTDCPASPTATQDTVHLNHQESEIIFGSIGISFQEGDTVQFYHTDYPHRFFSYCKPS